MKHKIAIIIFLFFATLSWAEINGSFEVGNYLEQPEIAFVRIELEWFVDWLIDFSLYGGWHTWFSHVAGDWRQIPFQDLYFIGARAWVGPVFLNISHGCLHPVIGGSSYFDVNRNDALTYVSAGVRW